MKYVRMAMKESPEQLGYDTIKYNLSEIRRAAAFEIGLRSRPGPVYGERRPPISGAHRATERRRHLRR